MENNPGKEKYVNEDGKRVSAKLREVPGAGRVFKPIGSPGKSCI